MSFDFGTGRSPDADEEDVDSGEDLGERGLHPEGDQVQDAYHIDSNSKSRTAEDAGHARAMLVCQGGKKRSVQTRDRPRPRYAREES